MKNHNNPNECDIWGKCLGDEAWGVYRYISDDNPCYCQTTKISNYERGGI